MNFPTFGEKQVRIIHFPSPDRQSPDWLLSSYCQSGDWRSFCSHAPRGNAPSATLCVAWIDAEASVRSGFFPRRAWETEQFPVLRDRQSPDWLPTANRLPPTILCPHHNRSAGPISRWKSGRGGSPSPNGPAVRWEKRDFSAAGLRFASSILARKLKATSAAGRCGSRLT